MIQRIEAQALQAFLTRNDTESVRAALATQHPTDIASTLAQLSSAEAARVLRLVPDKRQAQVFGYLEAPTQLALARVLDRKELGRIFAAMHPDERADLFKRLPEAEREALLPGLAHAQREDLRRLAAYPEGTVGAVMTSDYVTLPPDIPARQAIEVLRQEAPSRESIYYAYVLDAERRLIGVVSLRDLMLVDPRVLIADVMEPDVVSVQADAPREEAARLIAKYDLIALPVTDAQQRMVGVVTADDAMDIQAEEATLDFRKQGAIGPIGANVLTAPLWMLYRARVFWLVVLVFGNIFSGAGIATFEDMIAANVALVFFLPLLIDSGGNAGSQAATLMVRALALGDVRMKDFGKLIGRETIVAGMLGLTMALAVSVIGIVRAGPDVAMVVALSMVIIVMVGSTIGMSLPFILSRFGRDPATASAPLITSIADGVGVLIYFGLAFYVFGFAAEAG
jgi:magnesium transporter